MGRGFGIPATGDVDRAQSIAAECEELGYTSIWSNDIPKANGLQTAAFMAEATRHIRVGVGVIACDRRPAAEVARELERLPIPLDRLILGLGAGGSNRPLKTVSEAANVLREELGPSLTIGFAAMGPQMCALAGREADLVLFNWMVPSWMERSSRLVARGESTREDPVRVERAAYIRVAIEPGAGDRLHHEAEGYNRIPAYRRHFQAMGVPVNEAGVAAPQGEIPARLAAYDRVLDEAIVRALPALETVDSTLAVARAAAPSVLD